MEEWARWSEKTIFGISKCPHTKFYIQICNTGTYTVYEIWSFIVMIDSFDEHVFDYCECIDAQSSLAIFPGNRSNVNVCFRANFKLYKFNLLFACFSIYFGFQELSFDYENRWMNICFIQMGPGIYSKEFLLRTIYTRFHTKCHNYN